MGPVYSLGGLKHFFFSDILQVKERPDVGVYVKDLSAFVVNNADDMDRIMTLGNKNSKLSKLCHFVYFLVQYFFLRNLGMVTINSRRY
jgi:hypothetical protein